MDPGVTRTDAVAVPADHGGSSLACIRSLGRRGVDVVGVATDDAAPALRSKYCEDTHVAPSPADDLAGYGDALLDVARRPDVRTVVPLYEPDAYVLSKRRDDFADHVATPWPTFDAVRAAQDRHRLFDAVADEDVPAPETALLDDWPDWDRQVVVKPRFALQVEDGAATYGDVLFPEPGSPPDFEAVVRETGHVPIVQEYVPGDAEHGYFAVFDRGEPVAEFQHRRVRSYTYAGGASVFRTAVDDPDLAAAGRRTLETLDWHGPAMVEFKRDPRDGAFRLVEVNPRFWGSLPLAVHAGVDFPAVYYRLATGGVDAAVAEYETGLGCHTLRGEASYLHSVLRYDYDHTDSPSVAGAVRDVAASLVRHPNFDFLSRDDPRPFLQDALVASGLASKLSLSDGTADDPTGDPADDPTGEEGSSADEDGTAARRGTDAA